MKSILKNKKLFLILLILILLIIFFVIIIKKDKSSITSYKNNYYAQNTPILIRNGNKYGYISSNDGKKLIAEKYYYAERFYGNHALVKVKKSDNEYYRIIDMKNNVKLEFESYKIVKYINDYDIWLIDGKLYDHDIKLIFNENYYLEYLYNGLFKFEDSYNNTYGIVDYLGNKYYTSNNDIDLNTNTYNKKLNNIIIKEFDKSFIFNIKTKKILYETKDNSYEILFINNNVFKIILKSNDKKSLWIVLNDSNVLYETTDSLENILLKDKYIYLDYGYNFKQNNKKQRYYYYDINNKILLKKEPKSFLKKENEDGFQLIEKNKKIGLKKNGKVLLKEEYNNIIFLNLDLFEYIKYNLKKEIILLYSNNKLEIYDAASQEIINSFVTNNINLVQLYEESSFISVKHYKNSTLDKVILYNLITNKTMEIKDYDSFSTYSNYLIIRSNKKDSYYNSNFKKIYEIKI